jgi:hypothetical protein
LEQAIQDQINALEELKRDAQRKAIYATKAEKEGVNERLSGDAREAIYDLQDILDRAAQLGDEARQIVKDNFPNELSAGEAYDVFSFGTSSNSYDKTLETLISDIERTAEEEDEDMDEGLSSIEIDLDNVLKNIKTHLEMYKDAESPKNKQLALNMLKTLNDKKKDLLKQKVSAVAGIGKDQELSQD